MTHRVPRVPASLANAEQSPGYRAEIPKDSTFSGAPPTPGSEWVGTLAFCLSQDPLMLLAGLKVPLQPKTLRSPTLPDLQRFRSGIEVPKSQTRPVELCRHGNPVVSCWDSSCPTWLAADSEPPGGPDGK